MEKDVLKNIRFWACLPILIIVAPLAFVIWALQSISRILVFISSLFDSLAEIIDTNASKTLKLKEMGAWVRKGAIK